jgi:hypothetical protein
MGPYDSRTGRSTAIAYLKASETLRHHSTFYFSGFDGFGGKMVFFGGDPSASGPVRVVLDRFTPNLLIARHI